MYHQQIKELADIKKSLKWIGKAVLIDAMAAITLVHKCAEPKNIIRDLCSREKPWEDEHGPQVSSDLVENPDVQERNSFPNVEC